MQSALDWFVSLPPGVLYPMMALAAAIENAVPPFPADVTVAFGAFVAARGDRTMAPVFLAAWIGNVVGALAVYAVAARYGSARFERYIGGRDPARREARFHALLSRYGIAALFVARFVPGVRALVPAVAGALKLPRIATTLMLTSASAIWYGGIIAIAYRVEDWSAVEGGLASAALGAGILGATVLAIAGAAWLVLRRRRTP